jgi:hypothetical protein
LKDIILLILFADKFDESVESRLSLHKEQTFIFSLKIKSMVDKFNSTDAGVNRRFYGNQTYHNLELPNWKNTHLAKYDTKNVLLEIVINITHKTKFLFRT